MSSTAAKTNQQRQSPTTIDNDDASSHHSDLCIKFAWFLIGIGFLFPYNSVVTAVDFFASIYYPSIDFELGWLLLAPSLVILCITLKYGYKGTIYQRIIGTFLLEGILTIIVPLVRNVYVLYFGTFLIGCLSAILQGTLFSLLGFLGADLMSITQTGIGCSGVLVGLARILTKIFIPSDMRDSTYLYFLMAILMVFIDIFFLYIFVLHPSQRVQSAIAEDTLKNQALHAKKQRQKQQKKQTMHPNVNGSDNETAGMLAMADDEMQNYQSCKLDLNVNVNDDEIPWSLWNLFCASWKCQVAVFLNYTLTLSLFPGVLSLMQWNDNGDEWFAVIQIFLFNLFDTLGKNLTTYDFVLNMWNENGLLIASLVRFAFIPLFVMCVNPQIFSWQVAIVINAGMAVSNGLVGSSGFCLAPLSENVPRHEKGRASQMIATSLTAGLVGGASLAFLINFIMTKYL